MVVVLSWEDDRDATDVLPRKEGDATRGGWRCYERSGDVLPCEPCWSMEHLAGGFYNGNGGLWQRRCRGGGGLRLLWEIRCWISMWSSRHVVVRSFDR